MLLKSEAFYHKKDALKVLTKLSQKESKGDLKQKRKKSIKTSYSKNFGVTTGGSPMFSTPLFLKEKR